MKNKIKGLVFAVILLVSGICTGASAEFKPQNETAFLTSIGILKGDEAEKPNELLSRADAAYYALRVMGYTQTPKASSYVYGDVTGETPNADEIAYALSLGIISEASNFYPNDKVTVEQFMKMIISGMGYKSIAENHGGYPEGYLEVAGNLGILGKGGSSNTEGILYSNLDKLLSSILDAGFLEFSENGKYELSDDENILYDRFDIYKYNGTVTANAVTTLTDSDGLNDEQIKIANTVFDVSGHELYMDLSKKIGYKVNAYIKENDGGCDEIVYYEVQNNIKTEEIFSENVDDFSGGKLKYTKNAKTKQIDIPGSCNIIYNGKAVTYSLSGDLFKNKWGSVYLVKENGNVITMIITAYENYYVGAIDSEKYTLYDDTVNNRYVSFCNSDEELSKYAYFKNKTGADISFGQITVGSVVSVASNGDYYDVLATNETVTGAVKSVRYDNDDTYINVDSNTYMLSKEMDRSRVANIIVGKTYTFNLDACGRICSGTFSYSLGKDFDWVYLINIYDDEDESGLNFKVLLKSGKIINIKCADRVTIDGVSHKRTDTKLIKSRFSKDGIVQSQAMKLSVNDDGDINKVDTLYLNAEKENKSEAVHLLGDSSVARRWRSWLKSFNADFVLASDAVIFSVPAGTAGKADKGDNSEYHVATSDIWRADREVKVTAYNSNAYSYIAEAIVTTETKSVSPDNQDYVTVISELTQMADEDGVVGTVIKGIQNNIEISRFVSDESELTVGGVRVDVGDVIRFGVDYDGKIKNIILYYDASEKQFIGKQNLYDNWDEFQNGLVKAYRLQDGYLTAEADPLCEPDDENGKKVTIKTNAYRYVEVDMSGRKPSVSRSSISAVKDWYTYGDDYSYMFMQNRYYEARTLVIYKY